MIDRTRILYSSLAIADSAWLFAVTSIVGVIIGQSGSPLSWLVLLGVLALSMTVTWVAAGVGGDFITLALLQGVVGLTTVYGAVALRSTADSPGFDGFWFGRLLLGEYGQEESLAIIVSFVIAIAIWTRGARFIIFSEPWDALHKSFRIGVAAIALALIIQLARDEATGVVLIIFPFFAASLAGMSVGRLAEGSAWGSAQRIWGRVIGLTVGAVLAVGVVLGVLGAAYGSGPLGLFIDAAASVRDALFWVLEVILTPPLMALFWFIEWLQDRFSPGEQRGEQLGLGQQARPEPEPAREMVEAAGDSLIEKIIEVLVWPIGFMLLLVVFWILMKSFQRLRSEREEEPDADRESIRGDADARADLADLFGRLLPGFLKRGGGKEAGLRFPEGEPGITEVFQLYFRYLGAGMRRGAALESHLTPAELSGRLQAALPGAPVEQITRRFEAACYGHEPTGSELLVHLEAGLASIEERGPGG